MGLFNKHNKKQEKFKEVLICPVCYLPENEEDEFCRGCGTAVTEFPKIIKEKKRKEKERKLNEEEERKLKEKQLKREKLQQEAEMRKKQTKQTEIARLLYHEEQFDQDILNTIKYDMKKLNNQEKNTKWMKIGTLLSFNSTEQMIGTGFKTIMDQNKILIKQNELIRRQNEEVIKELKKLNEK